MMTTAGVVGVVGGYRAPPDSDEEEDNDGGGGRGFVAPEHVAAAFAATVEQRLREQRRQVTYQVPRRIVQDVAAAWV
jgi:hypothetical protein